MTWGERIEQALQRGYFTVDDKRTAISIETCSLGERLDGKCSTGEEARRLVGPSVYHLGEAFTYAVYEDKVHMALQLHNLMRAPEFPRAMAQALGGGG